MFNSKEWWVCTKCTWKGRYSETDYVMYSGIGWQHCPSCNSIVIPSGGSTALEFKNRLKLIGRIGEYEMSDDEIREAFRLKDSNIVKQALFKETRTGKLISLHPYFYLADDERFKNGFYSEI